MEPLSSILCFKFKRKG